MIPLILRLKKQAHREIAKTQDLIVEVLFSISNEAVMHGGTAIWRCYGGNRFSEDIDVYLPKNLEKIELFFEKMKQRGFTIEKKKIGKNSLYSNLDFNGTTVRFEALFKKVEGHLQDYETAESNFITINTLTAEELIKEKVQTYLKRCKIRDLYDIFFLLKKVDDRILVKTELKELIAHFQEPLDEKDLQVLILEGLVPSSEKMLEYIANWE